MRLSAKAEKLYNAKKYEDFFWLMAKAGDEAIRCFNQLCREDKNLGLWYSGFMKRQFEMIFADPEIEARASEFFKAGGMADLFDFFKNIHTFGFATAEEIAAAFGGTVEDVHAAAEKIPDKYKVRIPEA
jgi:hypothetical protein